MKRAADRAGRIAVAGDVTKFAVPFSSQIRPPAVPVLHVRLGAGIRVEQAELTPAAEQDAGHRAVAGIRRELLLATRPSKFSDVEAAAVSISALRDRTSDLHASHRSAALSSMGDELPGLLHDLRVALEAVPAAHRILSKLIPARSITKGHYSAQRLGRHWVDAGRAYHYRADHDRALGAILKAEQIAPQPTRNNPGARELVSHMLRTRRRNELVELGLRMGI